MLPSFLFSSYKQYKTDTDATASWLARTAQTLGYDLSLLTVGNAAQSSAPKLKGRARKLARDAAKANQKHAADKGAAGGVPQHIIAVKQFVSLAQYIASNGAGELPESGKFMSALSRAIKLRRSHSRWFYGQKDESLESANITHDHFTKVLRQVRQILSPLCQSTSSDTEETTNIENISNRFSALKIETPSKKYADTDSSSALPPSDKKAESIAAEYIAETPQTSFERYLAAHLLFHDAARIRRFVQHIWSAYAARTADLMACAMTTNTAIDLIHRMHEQFRKEHGPNDEYEEIATIFYGAQCNIREIDANRRLNPADPFNFEADDIADFVMLGTYVLLSSFADALVGGSIPATKPGFFGSPNLSTPRSQKSPRERFEEDKALLLPILPDVLFLSLDKNLPAEDMFLRAGRELYQTRRVTFWQVFASQVFLDIHHVMRSSTDRAFSDLKMHAQRIRESALGNLEFHKNIFDSAGRRNSDKGLRDLVQDLDTLVSNDLVGQMMRQKRVPSLPPPFQLMKHNPVFCGMIAFHFYLSIKEAGLVFANSAGSILSMIHLYNALQQEKLIARQWPDMDFVLSSQKETQLFVGQKPADTDDYLTRFCLAVGISAQFFASDVRDRRKVSMSKSGPRKLLDTSSPVSEVFRERLTRSNESVEISIQKVEAVIEDTNSVDPLDPYRLTFDGGVLGNVTLGSDVTAWKHNEQEVASGLAGVPPKTAGRDPALPPTKHQHVWKRQQKNLTPIQLLRLLFASVTNEIPYLEFSYFTFHQRCWNLLKSIQQEHDASFRKYLTGVGEEQGGQGYLQIEQQLPYIVGYTFAVAKVSQSLASETLPKDVATTSRLLSAVAKTVDRFLEAGIGSIGVMQLLSIEAKTTDENGKRLKIDVLDDGEDDYEEE